MQVLGPTKCKLPYITSKLYISYKSAYAQGRKKEKKLINAIDLSFVKL